MKQREIILCNLTLLENKKKIILKDVVYKESNGYYKNNRLGIKKPLKVINVEFIKSLGFESMKKGYTEVSKSDNERDDVTGAYI